MTNVPRTKVACPSCNMIIQAKGKKTFKCQECNDTFIIRDNLFDEPNSNPPADEGQTPGTQQTPPQKRTRAKRTPVPEFCPGCGSENFNLTMDYYASYPDLITKYKKYKFRCADCMEMF